MISLCTHLAKLINPFANVMENPFLQKVRKIGVIAAIGTTQIQRAQEYIRPRYWLIENRDEALDRIRNGWKSFYRLSEELLNDPSFILEAISYGRPELLQFASEDLRNDRAFLLEALDRNVLAVRYVPAAFWSDRGFVNRYYRRRGPSSFFVSFQTISQNPTRVLRNLLPRIQYDLPRVEYLNSPGSDQGGLARHLVNSLMESICDLSQQHLPLEEVDGKLIPQMEDNPVTQMVKQLLSYEAIGALFAFALKKHRNILIGNYFHPVFFEMIHSLSSRELDSLPKRIYSYANIPAQISNKLFSIYAKNQLRLTDDQIARIINNDIPQDLKNVFGYENRADFFNLQFRQKVLACLVISKSLITHLRGYWDRMKGETAIELARNIEGSLTKEQVKNALKWNLNHVRTKEYLEKWLNECSSKELEHFVLAISGLSTLGPDTKLNIYLYPESNLLPVYHTCTFCMDLPTGYTNYEIFRKKLELSLQSDKGFQLI